MLEINLMGGLGNQMFIYAFARSMQLDGYQVLLNAEFYNIHKYKVDTVNIEKKYIQIHSIRNLDIQHFNIKLPIIGYHNCAKKKMLYDFPFLIKIIKKINFIFFNKKYIRIDSPSDIKKIGYCNSSKKITIDGYFQDLSFFQKYHTRICQDFQLKKQLSKKNHTLKNKILQTENSCFLHVRRGDYLALENQVFVKLDENYYRQAINILLSKIAQLNIFVFSNDISWCKSYLIPKLNIFNDRVNFFFVEHNDEDNAIEEMELMRSCKHAIIANSTFSWWAAYLIQNPLKFVIAPSCFLIGENISSKLIPQNGKHQWITISI